MKHDERLEHALRSGLSALAGDSGSPPVDHILARTSRTRQRPARFPLQRSDLPSGAPGVLPGVPAWRPPMLSTVRYGTIAALVLAIGTTLPTLLGGTEPTDSLASPAASVAPGAGATWVIGTIALSNHCAGLTTTVEFGVGHRYRGFRCEQQVWSASDPRLTVVGATTVNADTYPAADGSVTISAMTMELSNDVGTWQCAVSIGHHRLGFHGMLPLPRSSDCTGRGAFEGLVAVVTIDHGATPPTFEAAIFNGDLPPAP